jgi:uncharacterized protein YciI
VHVLVLGRDGPQFVHEEHPLHEEHQAYMDRWQPRLLARGPLLSPDGDEHQGSVHVVRVDDPHMGHAFAFEEPFAAAGWYAAVTVTPYLPLTDGTMWDRPRAPRGTRSSFVTATSTPGGTYDDWVFAGSLLDADGLVVGFAGALDLTEHEAAARVPGAEVSRWRRGGRDQEV